MTWLPAGVLPTLVDTEADVLPHGLQPEKT